MRIFVLNGPNLDLLGQREPEIYGRESLDDIRLLCEGRAKELGIELGWGQSNSEGALIDALHAHRNWDGIVINAAGYTHTSLSIADAIAAIGVPTIEVHLSNVHARERIRRRTLLGPVVWGQISGFGYRGYLAALELLHSRLSEEGAG